MSDEDYYDVINHQPTFEHTHDAGEGCCRLHDGACCAYITEEEIDSCPVCQTEDA